MLLNTRRFDAIQVCVTECVGFSKPYALSLNCWVVASTCVVALAPRALRTLESDRNRYWNLFDDVRAKFIFPCALLISVLSFFRHFWTSPNLEKVTALLRSAALAF